MALLLLKSFIKILFWEHRIDVLLVWSLFVVLRGTQRRFVVRIQSTHHAYFMIGIHIIPKTFGFFFNYHDFMPNGTVFSKIEIPIAVVSLLKNNMLCHSFHNNVYILG